MKRLAIVGSTGSIGTNTLDVVRRSRHLYEVYALAAGQNISVLTSQIAEFHPKVVVVGCPEGIPQLVNSESGLIPATFTDVGHPRGR